MCEELCAWSILCKCPLTPYTSVSSPEPGAPGQLQNHCAQAMSDSSLAGPAKRFGKATNSRCLLYQKVGPGLLVPAFLLGQTTAETLSRESISIGEQSHRYVLKKYEASKSWLVSPDASPRANRDLRMPNIMFQMGFFFLPSPLCVQLRPVFLPPLLFGTYGCPHFNSKRWN